MDLETLFWNFAVFGTALFLMRAGLIFAGLGHDHGGDIYHDVDTAAGTESSFKLLSLTTVLAFVTAFGWAGYASLVEFESGPLVALIAALIAAVLVMGGVAWLFHSLISLETPGVQYRIEDTIGKSATVYSSIPAGGHGIIQVSFSGMLREINACSEDQQEIPSGASVSVTRCIDNNTVVVRKQ